jgi:hypothetical protein
VTTAAARPLPGILQGRSWLPWAAAVVVLGLLALAP